MITLTEPHITDDICKLVENESDLAELPFFETVYADWETSSGDPKLPSTNPWHHCKGIGVAYTGDDSNVAWFIPLHLAQKFLPKSLAHAKRWVNQNIKYDVHVTINEGIELPSELPLVCTIMLAHLVDSDREYKGGYSLEMLAQHWLEPRYRKRKDLLKPYLIGNQDFGRIPIDILGLYACGDVFVNRALHRYCLEKLATYGCDGLINNEIAFTRVLVDMERFGIYTNKTNLQIAELQARSRLIQIESELHAHLGYYINCNSSKQVFDLICNRFGCKVLKWGDPKKRKNKKAPLSPSFDKEAMEMYKEDADTPEALLPVIKLIAEFKTIDKRCSSFFVKYQELGIPYDDTILVLHAKYNQNVETGRLSCSEPNEQQLDEIAKSLINPPPGYVLLSFDQSQVEYRVIGNYMQSRIIIDAYANDPEADFHALVQLWCENIPRRPAKTINFLVAFGGGQKLIVAKLSNDFRKMGKGYSREVAAAKAVAVFDRWHEMLPENRKVRKLAEGRAARRGYVTNLLAVGYRFPVLYTIRHGIATATESHCATMRCH